MSILEIQQWANDTLAQGPVPDMGKPATQLSDWELAWFIRYHIDQIRICDNNLTTLEIWPENRSELFNEDLIYQDGLYHSQQLHELRLEAVRRHIP